MLRASLTTDLVFVLATVVVALFMQPDLPVPSATPASIGMTGTTTSVITLLPESGIETTCGACIESSAAGLFTGHHGLAGAES